MYLTFHGIGTPPRRLDDGEAGVWLSEDRFSAALDAVQDRPDVRVTFDDGNGSDLEYALPELRRRGMRAAFFVVAGRLGTPGFLDEDGVRALAAAGMEIGSHGLRHRPWRRLDAPALAEEVVHARRRLEEVVGRPVVQAACPFGAYDRRTLRWLRRHAYEGVLTSDRGTTRTDAWLRPRNTVHRDAGPAEIGRSGAPDLGRRVKLTVKRWR
jgi:peptidoglycan/xylan/chitin deacetylase (PgdA/CDA1 family)